MAPGERWVITSVRFILAFMWNGGQPSPTLVGGGVWQRLFSVAVGQLRKGRRGVEKKQGRAVGGEKGWVINSRSSSGPVSIVGVMGQMSAALMALPDAWLAPCPQP